MTNDQSSHPIWDQLVPYFTGECTDAERVAIDQWIKEDPQCQAELRRVEQIWRASWYEPGTAKADSKRMWAQIAASTHSVTQRTPIREHLGLLGFRGQNVLVGLMAALCVLILGFQARTLSEQRPAHGLLRALTPKRQTAQLTLQDGTVVLLGPASQIEIPESFNHNGRALQLLGEAIFSVAHHSTQPFTVTAGAATVRVLGTTFSVRHYSEDTAAVVAVRDGKVAVQSVILQAGDEVAVNSQGSSSVIAAQLGRFTLADGVLTLPWMDLRSAVKEIERWEDVTIVIATPELEQRKVRLTLSQMSSPDLAAFLETVLGIHVERTGNVLTLHAK